MASVTRKSVGDDVSAIRDPANAPLVDFIRKSAKTIHRTELVVAVLGLVVAACAWILSLILIDHWLWPLNEAARYGAWLTFIGGASWWIGTRVIPLLGRRINPEFAAKQIEQAVPEMKEGLISRLQLASHPTTSSRPVLNAVGRLVFRHLRDQDAHQIVDQFVPIKLMATLVGLIFMGALYLAVSPKSGAATVQRILFPWAKISPATRVQIVELTPGSTTVTEGSNLRVTMQVRGWHKTDLAMIRHSTRDGQTTDQLVPMKADIEGLTYLCDLGASFGGIVQPLSYVIEAGDAKAGPFDIQVQAVPLVHVNAVEYHYPKYMQLKSRTVEADGRIEGPEGTQIVLYGQTNQLPSRGRVEFDFKPSKDAAFQISKALDLEIDDHAVTAKWPLELDEARSNPTHQSYRLRFENKQGEVNSSPIVYPIRVIPDLPPEIDFLNELKDDIDLPINQSLELKLRAQDPDFGLSRISITAKLPGKDSASKELFQNPAGVLGNVAKTYVLNPKALNLLPGQKIEMSGIAEDNRHAGQDEHPDPNIRQSRVIRITLVEAVREQRNTEKNSKTDQVSGDSNEPRDKNDKLAPKETKPDQDSQSKTGNSSDSASSESPEKSDSTSDPNKQASSEKNPDSPVERDDQPSQNTNPSSSDSAPNGSMPNEPSNSKSSGEKSEEQQNGSKSEQDQKNTGGGAAASSNQGSSASEGREKGAQGDSSSKPNNQGENGSGDSTSGGGQMSSSEGSQGRSSSSATDSQSPQNGKPSFDNPAGEMNEGRNTSSDSIDEGETFEKLKEWLDEKQPNGVNQGKGQVGESKSDNAKSPPSSSDSPSDGTGGNSDHSSGKAPSPQQQGNESPGKGSSDSTSSDTPRNGDQPEGEQSASPKGDRAQDMDGKEKSNPKNSGDGNAAAAPRSKSNNNQASSDESAKGKDGAKSSSETSEKSDSPAMNDSNSAKSDSKSKSDGLTKDGKPSNGEGKEQGSGSDSQGAKNQSDRNTASKSGSSSDSQENLKEGQGSNSLEKSQSESPSSEKSNPSNNADPTKGDGNSQSQKPANANQGKESMGDDSGDSKKSDEQGGETGKAGTPQTSSSEKSSSQSSEAGSTSNDADSRNNPSKENSPSNKSKSGPATGTPKAGNLSGTARPETESEEALRDNTAETVAVREKIEAEAEYARQATDMILKALDRQRNQPDPELLKRMGWTKEQLQAFVDRWNNAREESLKNPSKQRDYDDALRSLGIVPSSNRNRVASERNDQLRGISEEGSRIRPPESLREKFEAFQKAGK